jgi:hypothetical protein
VVAAGAVVTKDVPAYAISEAIADRLARLCWWDWDHDALHAALPDFGKLEIEEFLEKYETALPASRATDLRRSVLS